MMLFKVQEQGGNSLRADDGRFHPISYRILTNFKLLLLSLVIDITWSAGSTPGTLAVRTFFICPKLTFIYPISYMDEIFYELSMDHRDYKNASAYQNFRGLRPAYRPQNCPKLTFIYPISYMDEIFHELSMDHRDYKISGDFTQHTEPKIS